MISELEKQSILEYLRSKHRRGNKRVKGQIITEVCERLSVGRKHAIKLLSPLTVGRPKKPVRRGRPGKYQDKAFQDSLRLMWTLTKELCGKRLKSAIPHWIEAVEEERGKFPTDIKVRLLKISAPTIDRILKPYKKRYGLSATRGGGFRDEIPIQGNIWNIQVPGHMETDTVAHCGGSLSGEYANSVTMVDIATLWTEVRAVYGRGSNAVFDGIKDIEEHLPFPMEGYDADNGGEVLNMQLYSYFVTERLSKGIKPVPVTRSRAYKKNDNAHVEQRNDSVARKYLGYARIDFQELIPLINHYYANLVCPFLNHFLPCFKLTDKVRVNSKTKRIYKIPVTPYQRIMESPFVSYENKKRLKEIHQLLNPVKLSRQIDNTRLLIDESMKRLKEGKSLPKNIPHYQFLNPLIPYNNTVSVFQIFHHAKALQLD